MELTAELFLEVLTNFLTEEENYFGLEVLSKLKDFLRAYVSVKCPEAIVFLLTQKKWIFKKSKDPNIKQIFGNLSFQDLQLLVEWAENLKDVIPVYYEDIFENMRKQSIKWNQLQLQFQSMVEPLIKFYDHPKLEKLFLYKLYEDKDKKHAKHKKSFSMIYEPILEDNKTCTNTEDSCNWLKKQYDLHKSSISLLSWEDFYSYIVRTLSNITKKEDLQNELFEMFGFKCFDLIKNIIEKSESILFDSVLQIKDINEQQENISIKQEIKKGSNSKEKVPALSSQVIIQSEEEKYIGKQIRKLQKKMTKDVQKGKGTSEDQAQIFSQIEKDYNVAKHEPLFKPVANTLLQQCEHVHDEGRDVRQKAIICGKPISIPFDALRNNSKKYDEVIIPPRSLNDAPKVVETVKIENLDIIGRMVFQNIKSFNEIQSEVFPVAYYTNENILISAPTGAGKTNIALMTIVHQIKAFIEDNVVQLHKFKIVYICPMKALAAEMANNFSKRLSCLGIAVKELTGDMQLSRREIMETQMLVVTPEKWDIISRKGTADAELTSLLKLLIIDEIHLLNTDRGPVIEALVARTLRQVISSQNMIRIVGLSATLPNYMDIASFLRVDLSVGLFYFDSRYRSVPLEQTFIGIKATKSDVFIKDMNEVCFNKVLDFLKKKHQVMVFVNARNETVKTANFFKEMAAQLKVLDYFQPENSIVVKKAALKANNEINTAVEDLLSYGLGIHHAGMLRQHRNLIEKLFLEGSIKCLICTATLAWGVNLPAHAVIIKGTSIYDSKKSSFVDMDILDVLQVFGRAGRPQYDTSGSGIIITSEEKMNHYLQLLTNQLPIESKLLEALPDHLNAEVVLGTVASIQEAVEWLTFTYFYKRARTNPQVYGLNYSDLSDDPDLREHMLVYVHNSAILLDKAHMIRYDVNTGDLMPTNLGRTASYFYINYDTIVIFNEMKSPFMQEYEIIQMMCYAAEFRQIQVRPEELEELDRLKTKYCYYPCPPVEDSFGKICTLMQTYLSRGFIKTLSLASDMIYITQSASRIARGLFDIALHLNQALFAEKCLTVSQMFERQVWVTETPLRQFPSIPESILQEIENRHVDFFEFRDLDEKQIKNLIKNAKLSEYIKQCAEAFPTLEVETIVHPITRGVIRVKLIIIPNFQWYDKFHGKACETFWIWVEDPDNNDIYHWESCTITKKLCMNKQPLELIFTIQFVEPRPSQYLIQIRSDRWLNACTVHPLPFRDLHLPESFTPHTDLLELIPLSVTALGNPLYESMFNFSHFNPIQTQIFHCLYHTDNNVLLGAPTGSGKTIAAELCIFRLFNNNPELKVVYIAPLKALVRERVEDWKERFTKILNKQVVEVTGDVTPSTQITSSADIIITTPEKWDGMSRGWQNRGYIREVGLMIIDEIHLLGEDRGPVLEVIVSRTNFISDKTGRKLRIIGLSTAMANAGDLANWLQIKEVGLYNFRPSVRPVPLEVHISGFPGKHYCPRMVSMNRPTYQAIRQHAPDSPSLVFCSSRKQTRLTASDLINFLATEANPKQWLKCTDEDLNMIISNICDPDLKHFLPFGIGIHHAGLHERDRKTVEELFINQKIQVLIATATLAWGVNFPAHLVVIKGTEYFDGRTKRYVDMPITDVLQMMGRAGRPQFDSSGVACVFVHDIKKNFYKKFLYEPFPIESNLLQVLPDHINAEISAGTISTKRNLVEYLTWTYFFRRLVENPLYYNLPAVDPRSILEYLSELVDAVISNLVECNCVTVSIKVDNCFYEATFYGHVASFYYLSHKTMAFFQNNLKPDCSIEDLLYNLCHAEEYVTFPVRHNEDQINRELVRQLNLKLVRDAYDSPHLKVLLLLQAHFLKVDLPNQEYIVDLKSVMDQALRILQAILDIVANQGWLSCALRVIHLMQMIIQGQLLDEPTVLMLPYVTRATLPSLAKELLKIHSSLSLSSIVCLYTKKREELKRAFTNVFGAYIGTDILKLIGTLPYITMNLTVFEIANNDEKIILTKEKVTSLTMYPEREYEFSFSFQRICSSNMNVEISRFPKKKDEGWILCLGVQNIDEVLCMKRVIIKRNTATSLRVTAPSKPGSYTVSIYLLSDSYLGLDQQYEIKIQVVS